MNATPRVLPRGPAANNAIKQFLHGFSEGRELGRGIAGRVTVAHQRGTVHALKRIALEIDLDCNGSTVEEVEAEVAVLKRLGCHPNVIELRDYCIDVAARQAVLVLSPGDMTLELFLRNRNGVLPMELARSFELDLLLGLCHIHQLDIIHRDLKPNNTLLHVGDLGGVTLRICDFGQARRPGLRPLSLGRQAAWYRCPEMILGEDEANYSFPIDMWGAGAILAELLIGKPLFLADCEVAVLYKIFEVLGTPSSEEWPGCTTLPGWKSNFPAFPGKPIRNFKDTGGITLPRDTTALLQELLVYCPTARIKARGATEHECFAWTRQRRSTEGGTQACLTQGVAQACLAGGAGGAQLVGMSTPPTAKLGQSSPEQRHIPSACTCSGNCGPRHHNGNGTCRETVKPGTGT